MTTTIAAAATAVKFHLSLNVSDLPRSAAFYGMLFGREPARSLTDYARFELDDPPLVLSLTLRPHGRGGPLNHLGFCVASFEHLLRMQATVEAAGFPAQREDGVECCHSRQTKFWVADPDANQWEIYIRETEEDHDATPERSGACRTSSDVTTHCEPAAAPRQIWEHSLGAEFPATIPSDDRTLDEVFLRGTLNDQLDPSQQQRLLRESHRVLRPGGLLRLHGLVADRELDRAPLALPGPASSVRRVPTLEEILQKVMEAGFSDLLLERYGPAPCFAHGGVPLRELLLQARPNFRGSRFDLVQTVVYRGPLAEVRDDQGNIYRRGEPSEVSTSTASRLRESPTADQFVFLQQ